MEGFLAMSPALKAVGEEAQRIRMAVERRSESVRSVVSRLEEWLTGEAELDAVIPRILVVDDNEILGRSFIRAAEKAETAFVDHASSLELAVAALSSRGYDGCIVDLGMDGLGTTFCKHVRYRSMKPMIPILIYTGQVDGDTAKKAAIRCGANGAMLKANHSVEDVLAAALQMCVESRSLEH